MKFRDNISYTSRVMLRIKIKYKIKQRAITQKLNHAELQFLFNALLLDDIYPFIKFHDNISYTSGVMLRTTFKHKIEERAITQKLSHVELQFLCNALFLDDIYLPMKFHDNISYTLGVMLQTKFKYEIKQRAITQNLSHAELQFLCNALFHDDIYPPMKFHENISCTLGAMLWTKI